MPARLAKLQVVLDGFLIVPLKYTERRDALEIFEDRSEERFSIVVTSQLPPTSWHLALGDQPSPDAICDRVVQNAHVLKLTGPSGRGRKAVKPNSGLDP